MLEALAMSEGSHFRLDVSPGLIEPPFTLRLVKNLSDTELTLQPLDPFGAANAYAVVLKVVLMKVLAASIAEALVQLLWSEVWLAISCPSWRAVL
jgi:hypothetical protein